MIRSDVRGGDRLRLPRAKGGGPPSREDDWWFLAELRRALDPRSSLTLWLVGAAAIASWSFALTQFTLVGDDWSWVFPEPRIPPQDIGQNLRLGRWLAYAINLATDDASFAPSFSAVFALAVLIVIGIGLAVAGGLPEGPARAVFASAVVVSPLHSEYLSFKLLHLPEGVGLLLASAAAAIVAIDRRFRLFRAAVAVGLVTLAFATYQPTGLYFLAGVTAVYLLRRVVGKEWRASMGVRLLVTTAVVYVVATLLYAITVRLSWMLTSTQASELPDYKLDSGYAGLNELLPQARDALTTWTRFWLGDTSGYPVQLKVLTIGLILIGAAGAVYSVTRREGWRSKIAHTAEVVIVLAIAVLGPFIAWFIRDNPLRRYNTISSLSIGIAAFVTAGVLAAVSPWRTGQERRRPDLGRAFGFGLVGLVVLVVAGHSFLNARDLGGHVLSNQRDFAFANRLLWRIEQLPGYTDLIGIEEGVGVGIVGRFEPHFAGRPFRFVTESPSGSIVGCGAVECQPSRLVRALNLLAVDGTVFTPRSAASIADVAGIDIDRLPSWPAEGSVILSGTSVLVKVG